MKRGNEPVYGEVFPGSIAGLAQNFFRQRPVRGGKVGRNQCQIIERGRGIGVMYSGDDDGIICFICVCRQNKRGQHTKHQKKGNNRFQYRFQSRFLPKRAKEDSGGKFAGFCVFIIQERIGKVQAGKGTETNSGKVLKILPEFYSRNLAGE